MEEFFNILVTIGMVILAVAASRKKKPKQAKTVKPATDMPDDLPEGWPFPRELFPGAEPARPAPKRKQPHRPKTDAKPARTAPPKPSAGPDKNGYLTAEAKRSASSIAPCPESDAERPETADFDLRKAVIWSEILKPKFNE